ncbi:MAG TPA: Mrp/NBP35 family ATP-binding protein [Bacteroidia bacterium]|jgi:ATP-binding protein involved in chromosome partitioning|nr:Mrp/NBP35 family ATP-binding protein [Bacteroidia bacterium]
MITQEQVLEALKNVIDPDFNKDIVTLGMVKDVAIDGKNVNFTVELTTPACPMKEMIHRACVNAITYYVDKEAIPKVNMTARVTSKREPKQSALPGVKNIIAVASGKGGVGKSTVASNLAVALAMTGAKVGLLDADIYGPSVPMMFDVADEKPMLQERNGKTIMIPLEHYGVKLLSIGFFVTTSQALPWRGPMASKALQQLILDSEWGELDYLIIDLPPGTGDIQLSLVSSATITGAVIVSTPQNVALADVRKAITMFGHKDIHVPVLGIVENMAYFTPAELPDNKYFIFGKDGAKNLAEELKVPFLGQVPLVQSICEAGDAGRPAVLQENTPQAKAFLQIAGNLAQQVAIANNKKEEKQLEHA